MKKILFLTFFIFVIFAKISSANTIGYWRFEEGTNNTIAPLFWSSGNHKWFKDSSGSGNDVPTWNSATSPRYINDVISPTSQTNNLACRFYGDDDLWSEGATTLNTGTTFSDGWTIEASVKLFSTNSWQVILGKDGNPNSAGPPLFSLKFNVDNQFMEMNVYDGATNNHWLNTGKDSIKIGTWYHLAAVCNGGIINFYLKEAGERGYILKNSAVINGKAMADFYGNWSIGRGQWNGSNTDWANAIIDEVKISDEALSVYDFIFADSDRAFVEDWSPNPLGSNWYNVGGGTWNVYDSGNGAWLWADNTADTNFRRQVCYERAGDNYTHSVRLRIFGAQAADRPRFGIFTSVFDSYDENSFTVGIDITGKFVYAIAKKDGNVIATTQSASYPPIDLTQWHDLSVEKSGDQFTISFDGTALLTLNADLCGGRFGVFTEGSHADFWTNQFTDSGGIPCEERMLFQRHGSRGPAKEGLAIYADSSASAWRSLHAANASFLKYTDPNDGIEKIYLYFRGTPLVNPQTNLKIGLWTQPASTFDPEGSWEITSNGGPWTDHGVVIGGSEWYDDYDVLDTCAVAAPNGDIYIYYLGRDTSYNANVCVAKSTDGGYSFTKSSNNPLIENVGPTDTVYHNGKYYIFYADTQNGTDKMRIRVKVTSNPESLTSAETYLCISPNVIGWDSGNVGGARVFKLGDKWWMIYQAGWTFDYQKRFHAAYSDDLTNWTKVINCKPLFLRGETANWDQGAIWGGETFAWNDKLYMFYEGWGTDGFTTQRDVDYFSGGHSQLGLAIATTNDFFDWSGLNEPLYLETLGYWRFEEGTNNTIAPLYWNGDGEKWFKDSSGNGNDMPTWDWWSSPRYTNDVAFNIMPQSGESNLLSCWFGGGNSPNINDDLWSVGATFMNNGINFTEGWTVEAIVKFLSTNLWQVIIGRDGAPEGGAPLLSMKFNVSNQGLDFNVYDGETNNHWLSTGNNSVLIGTWYSFAAVCDAREVKLYMKRPNDIVYTEMASDSVSGGAMAPYSANWTIGRGWWGNAQADHANAIIDEVRICAKSPLPMQFNGVDIPEPAIYFVVSFLLLITFIRKINITLLDT